MARCVCDAIKLWRLTLRKTYPLERTPPMIFMKSGKRTYNHVQNTPLLRSTEPNLFQTLESLNSDQISKLNGLNSFV